jgi:hypothetical protein
LGGPGEESVGTEDHTGGADQDLITILEFIGNLRRQAFPLHHNPIRRPEIFNDKRVATPQEPRMAATHMVLGQTEKTLRMAPNARFIGQRKTFPTVESLKYFQVRHSFYPLSRRSGVDQLHALAFLSVLGMGHLRPGKMR